MGRLKPRVKRIALDFMGEEWAECYLEFRAFTWGDVAGIDTEGLDNAKATTKLLETLKSAFLGGKGVDMQGETVELAASDLDDLDLETLTTVTQRLTGQPDPNG